MGNLKDEAGKRYGRLVVLRRAGSSGNKATWLCQCDCGNETVTSGQRLRDGRTRSCGCLRARDEIGHRYGHLTVVAPVPSLAKRSGARWLCKCDCGNEVIVGGVNLRRGTKEYCGWDCPLRLEESALNRYQHHYESGCAGARSLEWRLTKAQFRHIVKQPCHYCGVEPLPKNARLTNPEYKLVCNGIDRMDNSKGYTPDNVVPCCSMCNQAKHMWSYDEFLVWMKRLVDHWPQMASVKGPFDPKEWTNVGMDTS